MSLSINLKKPIGNGIITCLNKTSTCKKKGAEAVNAVLSVLSQKWELLIVRKIIQE